MKIALKRCPFCNSHNLTVDLKEFTVSIRCSECGTVGPFCISLERAADRWNVGYPGSSALVNMHPSESNRNDLKEVDL